MAARSNPNNRTITVITTPDDLKDLPSLAPLSPSVPIDEHETNYHHSNECDDDGTDFEVPTDEVTIALIKKCNEHGKAFKKVKDIVDEMRADIIALKDKFGVRRGVCGKRLVIGEHAMLWSEYLQTYFGCTSQYMNRILNISDQPLHKAQPNPRESENYKLGIQEATQKHEDWKRAQLAVGTVFKRDTGIPRTEFTAVDPYVYWHQFASEPQTLASELVAMFIELKMDAQQINQVIDLLKKETKAQTAELAKATKAGK
jgi:hypothetical protein